MSSVLLLLSITPLAMTFTVGIAGVTGRFARLLLANLLRNPDVAIRGYCRDPTKLSNSIQSQVYITKGAFDDTEALRSFVRGTDIVICTYLGDNHLMIEGQKHLIDACESEGVKRYLASDYTLDFTKLQYGQLPPKDPMIVVKDYLNTKTVKGVHVLIGAFMDTFWSHFFGVWDPTNNVLQYWGTGKEVWEVTSYANAAEFVAEVALDKDAVGLQEFLGDRKTIFEIAEIFDKVYGVKPKLQNLGSQHNLYEKMHKLKDENSQNPYAWLALFYNYYCINGQANLNINNLDGQNNRNVKRVTMEDFLRGHLKEELSTANDNVGRNIV